MSDAAAKERAGYIAATHRDRCDNCKHCVATPPEFGTRRVCQKHGFAIKPGAICSSYVRAFTPPPL